MEILNNDTSIDLTHKINSMEIDNWMNHLIYLKKELLNLLKICSKELSEKLEVDELIVAIEKKVENNDKLLFALQNYINADYQLDACEDTTCVTVNLSNHESFRRSYQYHITKHERLKTEFNDKLNSNLDLLKHENLELSH